MAPITSDADIHARLAAASAALDSFASGATPPVEDWTVPEGLRVAVLIPCYNEAAAVAQTIEGFRAALPGARIYVFDNNSTDDTARIARDAGAVVRREPLQGKGHVVRRMFSDIDADIYVMADGDATYDATAAPKLIRRLIETGADMAVGARVTEEKAAYRAGHRFGNWMLTTLVAKIFGDRLTDMLSGYRVVTRRFAKSYPALASGFETETELTVHALELDMITTELQTRYAARPQGSVSKLNTVRDGLRILATIGRLVRDERPLAFFGAAGLGCIALAAALGAPVVAEYFASGLVPRFPTAILAASIAIVGCLSAMSGIILETVSLGRREMKRLAYNSVESLVARLERLDETRRELETLRGGRRADAVPPQSTGRPAARAS